MMPLSWLPGPTLERIQQAAAQCGDCLKAQKPAILVVGAAVNPARPDRGQSPELLVVVDQVTVADLHRLADQLRSAMSHGIRLRVVTREELRSSADVFALEIADYRDRHVLLHGKDPFAELDISPGDLRRSLEQAIRGLSRRMRNRVLAGLATQNDNPQVALEQGIDRLVAIAHHALTLAGDEAPRHEAGLLEALGKRADANPEAIVERLAQVRRGKRFDNAIDALGNLMDFCDGVSRWVDAIEVGE